MYNKLLAEDLTKWIFQETGVVKIVATHHHRAGETEPPEMYTKKDDLVSLLTPSVHLKLMPDIHFDALATYHHRQRHIGMDLLRRIGYPA